MQTDNSKMDVTKLAASSGDDLLARNFQLKLIDQAKRGRLGTLRSFVPSLQQSYLKLVHSLDDNVNAVLIQGQKGSGKKTLVSEYLKLYSLYRRLKNLNEGKLIRIDAKLIQKGFFRKLKNDTATGNVYYIEKIERLDSQLQDEWLEYIDEITSLDLDSHSFPKVMFSCESSLTLKAIHGQLDQLFVTFVSMNRIFLPRLKDRFDDLPLIVNQLLGELAPQSSSCPQWLLAKLQEYQWPFNVLQLKKVFILMIQKCGSVDQWTLEDFPLDDLSSSQIKRIDTLIVENDEQQEKKEIDSQVIQHAMMLSRGNRSLAAKALGISKAQLLQFLLHSGLR